MDQSSILRKLKIDLITDAPNSIVEWFNDIWKNLHVVQANVYHDMGGEYIYYLDDNIGSRKYIFFYDENGGIFYSSSRRYHEILESKLDTIYREYQSITKLLVENAIEKKIAQSAVNDSIEAGIPIKPPQLVDGNGYSEIEIALKHTDVIRDYPWPIKNYKGIIYG